VEKRTERRVEGRKADDGPNGEPKAARLDGKPNGDGEGRKARN
jgi:hypothetical protein